MYMYMLGTVCVITSITEENLNTQNESGLAHNRADPKNNSNNYLDPSELSDIDMDEFVERLRPRDDVLRLLERRRTGLAERGESERPRF